MASLYIKDPKTAALAAELAAALGTSKTQAVHDALERRKAELQLSLRSTGLRERLDAVQARYPRPRPTGHAADKAFFDAMWQEP